MRHVGDPVAMVIADSIEAARSAAERIGVEYRILPAVTGVVAAMTAGAPRLYEDVAGNLWQRLAAPMAPRIAITHELTRLSVIADGATVRILMVVGNANPFLVIAPATIVGTHDPATTGLRLDVADAKVRIERLEVGLRPRLEFGAARTGRNRGVGHLRRSLVCTLICTRSVL